MEKTLILIKPDAVQRGLVGEIMSRLERKGLKLVGLKMLAAEDALLDSHYAHITGRDFYADIKDFMKSSPLVAMVWEGSDCISSVRILVGPTRANEAAAGTIRGDLAITAGRNVVHASDSAQAATEEIARFFSPDEIFSYDKTEYTHLYAPDER